MPWRKATWLPCGAAGLPEVKALPLLATPAAPASVLKKLKDKKFAAGVDRAEVAEGVKLLGVDLAEHVGFIIAALRERAEEFGLTGAK